MAYIQLQFRRGTAAEWTAANSVLAIGEFGLETDTSYFKVGDGVTAWNSLAYGGIQGIQGPTGPREVATIYTLTGDHIDPANGDIQIKTISVNTTFTEELSSGESVILQLNGGSSYTVTWMNTTWVTSSGNSVPTLTANDTFVFWKVDTTLYGAYVGSHETFN